MPGRPLIGITCATAAGDSSRPRFALYQTYARAVAFAGGAPLLIPALGSAENDALRSLFDTLDGLLLPGGADLQPSTYGAEPNPELGAVDPALDETELQLACWALDEEKPILGICRGQQALNVAAGGTLYQDIRTEIPDALSHRHEERDALVHDLLVDPDSRLADLLEETELKVNSLHHQAVRDVASGFRAVGHAPDGVIEGIERPDHPFAVAVQYHPEELVHFHEPSVHLLRRFVAATAHR